MNAPLILCHHVYFQESGSKGFARNLNFSSKAEVAQNLAGESCVCECTTDVVMFRLVMSDGMRCR